MTCDAIALIVNMHCTARGGAVPQVDAVTFEGWRRIAQHEAEEGRRRGKPAEKITDVQTMMKVAMAS
jgi:NADPH-dependent glutamate synthase beta subunit-like oxidoreductase